MVLKHNSLTCWAGLLIVLTLFAMFLHESAHGVGARIDGTSVSTGFNRVGAPGKRPSDPDFREGYIVTGKASVSDVAGPLVNWLLALACALWLYKRAEPNLLTMGIAAFGLANAFLRLVPMANFFFQSVLGNIALEDEVGWGLGAIRTIQWPVSLDVLRTTLHENPGLFLGQPAVFLWPAFSLGISILASAAIYRRLRFLLLDHIDVSEWRWFALMPLLVFPIVFGVAQWLDERVRITW